MIREPQLDAYPFFNSLYPVHLRPALAHRPHGVFVGSFQLVLEMLIVSRWGEPVVEFLACILQHARDRYYLPDSDGTDFLDVPYWVCACTDPVSLTELTVRIVVDAKICRCHFGRQKC